MKIIIQQRDIQTLKFVFACRVVSYDQIIRRHFPKTDEALARRRIRKLAEGGYLQISIRDSNGKAVRTAQPLPACWSVISEKWPFGVDAPHFKSKSPEHDVRAAEVFMKFEKLKCFRSYFTENLLQSSSTLAEDPRFRDLVKIQADGALSLEDAKGNLRVYGIEYELSKKSPDGYKQKLTDYFLAKGIQPRRNSTQPHQLCARLLAPTIYSLQFTRQHRPEHCPGRRSSRLCPLAQRHQSPGNPRARW